MAFEPVGVDQIGIKTTQRLPKSPDESQGKRGVPQCASREPRQNVSPAPAPESGVPGASEAGGERHDRHDRAEAFGLGPQRPVCQQYDVEPLVACRPNRRQQNPLSQSSAALAPTSGMPMAMS